MSEVKTFTSEHVAEHNTRKDIWVSIHGKVYDVSKFLDEHPGGEEVILECAGLDATEAFDDIGHSEDARELLKDFYVGELDGPCKKTDSRNTNDIDEHGQVRTKQNSNSWGILIPLAFVVLVVAYKMYA
ncbi:hypothetical protein LPJ66_001448 [Kickxella alabastrina]|uniref:Uncharacterized protein n=1 Tax=Kickxella alabastrina TaxID=61397 RepID=A0ACC1IT72_9FUNG|nr:hypothetical protein LPJ66_001448 [Kickxella alabastrina]